MSLVAAIGLAGAGPDPASRTLHGDRRTQPPTLHCLGAVAEGCDIGDGSRIGVRDPVKPVGTVVRSHDGVTASAIHGISPVEIAKRCPAAHGAACVRRHRRLREAAAPALQQSASKVHPIRRCAKPIRSDRTSCSATEAAAESRRRWQGPAHRAGGRNCHRPRRRFMLPGMTQTVRPSGPSSRSTICRAVSWPTSAFGGDNSHIAAVPITQPPRRRLHERTAVAPQVQIPRRKAAPCRGPHSRDENRAGNRQCAVHRRLLGKPLSCRPAVC